MSGPAPDLSGIQGIIAEARKRGYSDDEIKQTLVARGLAAPSRQGVGLAQGAQAFAGGVGEGATGMLQSLSQAAPLGAFMMGAPVDPGAAWQSLKGIVQNAPQTLMGIPQGIVSDAKGLYGLGKTALGQSGSPEETLANLRAGGKAVFDVGTTIAMGALSKSIGMGGRVNKDQAALEALRQNPALKGDINDFMQRAAQRQATTGRDPLLAQVTNSSYKPNEDLTGFYLKQLSGKSPEARAAIQQTAENFHKAAAPFYREADPQPVTLNDAQASILGDSKVASEWKIVRQGWKGDTPLPEQPAAGDVVPAGALDALRKRLNKTVTGMFRDPGRYNEAEETAMLRDALSEETANAVPAYRTAHDLESVNQRLKGAVLTGQKAAIKEGVNKPTLPLPGGPEAGSMLLLHILHQNPIFGVGYYGARVAAQWLRQRMRAAGTRALGTQAELMLKPASEILPKLAAPPTAPTGSVLPGGGMGVTLAAPADSTLP